jgi:structural maintenance of chromosomes protein 5
MKLNSLSTYDQSFDITNKKDAGNHGSVEELEAQLEEEENALRINQQTNSMGVLEAYEKRAKDIEETKARMEGRQAKIEEIGGQITHFRGIWEPRLQNMVNRVSIAFGEAFKSIGCAGEVLLSKSGESADDVTDDFEKWAIHIKVKFRETEKLQILTGQRQSGGERSVSTIFYLMALQELAKAPFRVVDEINQGMDPRNERLVHGRMVDAACRPDTSQYAPRLMKLMQIFFDYAKVIAWTKVSSQYEDSYNQ